MRKREETLEDIFDAFICKLFVNEKKKRYIKIESLKILFRLVTACMYYRTVKVKKNALLALRAKYYSFFFIKRGKRKRVRSLPWMFVPRAIALSDIILTILRRGTSISLRWRARKIGSVVETEAEREVEFSPSPRRQLLMNIHRRGTLGDPFVPFFSLFHSSSCTINGYMQITAACCIMLIAYACTGSKQVYSEWSYFVSCICIYANSAGSM